VARFYDIVGCGAAMRTFHIPALRSLASDGAISVRGCFDSNLERAKQVAELLGARSSGVPEDIGALDSIDAAIIATPPESHCALAARYLAAGKHVFVEKPFVADTGEAKQLIDLAEANGARIFVNHIRRTYPSVQIARRFVTGGGLGTISRVYAGDGVRWGWTTTTDFPVRSPYGGVIYDFGSHTLDSNLYILGLDEPQTEVEFAVRSRSRWPDREPSHDCRAELELASRQWGRLPVSVRLSRRDPVASAVKVYGQNGVLVVPALLSDAPVLHTQGGTFILRERATEPLPFYFNACVLLAHHQFLQAQETKDESFPLDGRNLMLLTALLETLAA
jgi:predicted dehydrogenase